MEELREQIRTTNQQIEETKGQIQTQQQQKNQAPNDGDGE
jgi:TolA-binding protein